VPKIEHHKDKNSAKKHSVKTTVEMPASPPKVLYKYKIQDDEIPYIRRGRQDPSARRNKARSKRL
jgi:hypothetical protein